MAIDNLYNSLSKFSISSLFHKYIFDTSPANVYLNNQPYFIYPLGVKSGMIFYHVICSSIFENIQIDYFNNPTPNLLKNTFSNENLLDSMFKLIDEIYNFDSSISLYELLQKSNIKEVKYLFYVIKQQNFTYYESNQWTQDAFSSVFSTIEQLDKIVNEYAESKEKNIKTKNKLIEVDAVEYNEVNSSELRIDYTTQFYKDYIIGNEAFYSIVSNTYFTRFISIAESIPYILNNDTPVNWCKINNDKCTQACKFFDVFCQKRYIKSYSYLPFKSMFVFPQILSLINSTNRYNDIDNFIRAFLYAFSVTFGEKTNSSLYYKIEHNNSILPLIDKNKFTLIKSLFKDFNFKNIEVEVRTSLGLKESKEDSIDNIYDTLIKIYTFVNTNKTAFVPDDTRMEIFSDFLESNVRPLLFDKRDDTLEIKNDDDFTAHLLSMVDAVIEIDNMLKKFPHDMKNVEKIASDMLKMMQTTKRNLAKMGATSGKTIIDPRETLLTSDNSLFKRIAIDGNLQEFYRINNKTRLINNILFWKWTLGYSFLAGIFLRLPEDHAIQTMNFNEE